MDITICMNADTKLRVGKYVYTCIIMHTYIHSNMLILKCYIHTSSSTSLESGGRAPSKMNSTCI